MDIYILSNKEDSMNKRLFFSGIISILLIFAFLAGCDNGTTTEYVPGPTVTVPGPTVTVPGPTVEVPMPGQNYNALVKALLDAGDAYLKDPSTTPVVTITGQIPVQGNSDLKVPDYVILEIAKGARLTIEANAMLYVREKGKVVVKGELYFERYANWDDVRQAKIVGDIDVDGGTVYDKSDEAFNLQHVSKIYRGGKLVYSGGAAVAQDHEKFVLGYPDFTGDGYIKMVYSDGWSKFNLVRPANPPVDNLLTHPAAGPADPALLGFEVIGTIELTSGDLVLPDSVAANQLAFTVKKGSKLTIGQGASLISQSGDLHVINADEVCRLIVDEGASIEVSGLLGYPPTKDQAAAPPNVNPVSRNDGTITVLDSGALFINDWGDPVATLTSTNNGTVILKGGSRVLYDRGVPIPEVLISTGPAAKAIQTSSKTDITFTPALMTISGDKASFKNSWPTPFALPLSLAITNKAEVTAKGAVTGKVADLEITVSGGGKLILETKLDDTGNALAGITVSGEGSEVIAKPTADFFEHGPLTVKDKGTGTFIYPAAAVALPPNCNPDGPNITLGNGANIVLKGAASFTEPAGAIIVENYNVKVEAPVAFDSKAVTLKNAKFTGNITGAADAVTLTDSEMTMSSGTVDSDTTGTWVLVNSTVNFNNLKSGFTGSAAITMSLGSIVNVTGELSFSGAAAAITVSDASSKITGKSGAKITSTASGTTDKLTITAAGGANSVKGLTFTSGAATIAAGTTATYKDDTTGWEL